METNGEQTEQGQSSWARPIDQIDVKEVPVGATNLNLAGHRLVSPMQGFGPLWQKTYRIHLTGVKQTAGEVMQLWKARFPEFQPRENHFYPSLAGIRPGEVLFIDATVPALPNTPSVLPVASGVVVLYVDDTSFTVMTPEGFPESGWNTFSVQDDHGEIYAQVQSLARTTDPIYEFAFRFLGSSLQQEKVWRHVLTHLAAAVGVTGETVTMEKICLDNKIQWSQARNIWRNAGVKTIFFKLASPFRWAGSRIRRP